MSHEVVRYHNDFNKINLSAFTEQEYNILMGILSKLKSTKAGIVVDFSYADLLKFCAAKKYTKTALLEVMKIIKEKFFKADFTRIVKVSEKITCYETINLFDKMAIYAEENEFEKGKKFRNMVLSVNPMFEYILKDLFANFTQFELEEFFSINGKYTKILYQHLKQFRKKGLLIMKWTEFLELMGIPINYKMGNIDQRILKPAIKELSKPRTLFDQDRIIFENLKYEKIKEKGTRGRGGKVTGIRFTFTPELNLISKTTKTKIKNKNIAALPSRRVLKKINTSSTSDDLDWEEFKNLDRIEQEKYILSAIESLPPEHIVKKTIDKHMDLDSCDINNGLMTMIRPQILKIFKDLRQKN